ncbi:MAG: SWF/SNF helicase family protein [Ilumatobacteraceae bacterium]|nr:SWF/SNF helicase family protein [Ilumatobacteraceae bacterium]
MAYLEAPPNLMQKRLAATIGDRQKPSAKFQRLIELVDEHREAGHKIVIFSFFRYVISDISRLLKTDLTITGDSSPAERQRVIDSFGDAAPGAVLVSQIDAGGIGVNLQTAQVVIVVEPQFKPSTEWQAIARVHRMGQSRPVVVHRLLARDTVDEHLVALINAKEQDFFAYAHDSAIKHESHMATDTSSSSVANRLQKMLDSGEIT